MNLTEKDVRRGVGVRDKDIQTSIPTYRKANKRTDTKTESDIK